MLNSLVNEIAVEMKKDNIEEITLDSNYIQSNITAFQYLRKRDYPNAKNAYMECIRLAEQMNDEYKLCDSLCNLAIVQFFCGKLPESLESLESSYRLSMKWENINSNNRNNVNNQLAMIKFKQYKKLNLKILSNLCLATLAVNKLPESVNYCKSLIEFIQRECDARKQLSLLKSALYIFFRVESLMTAGKENIGKIVVTAENAESEEVHQKIVKKVLNEFHRYLQSNDIDIWIQCLAEESENFKTIKDYNGFIFAVFNQHASLYAKHVNTPNSASIINTAKLKITSLSKVLIADKDKVELEEKSAEKILSSVKEKMETAVKVYQLLMGFESELKKTIDAIANDNDNDNETDIPAHTSDQEQSSPVFIKLLLKYALFFLDKQFTSDHQDLKKQMKTQIELTLKLIDSNEIDLSSIKLSTIDPDISNAMKILFDNLMTIYYHSKIQSYFTHYVSVVRNERKLQNDQEIENFMNLNLSHVSTGDVLTKINLTSSGKKEHFYKLDTTNDSIFIMNKKSDKSPSKILSLQHIKKFSYGISSDNLRKRFKNIQNSELKSPWLFMSIITKDRSIDLYMEEQKLLKWFYGMSYYLKTTSRKYKIMSTSNFNLTKLKLKMLFKLKEENEKNRITEPDYKNLVKSLCEEKGIQKFSFIKIFLLFKKITKIAL